jgi:hypothetical protein
MSENDDLRENLEKMRFFRNRLSKPISQEEREAIMGITSDIDKLTIEKNAILAQLEQLRMEKSELEELRLIRDTFAYMVQGGYYDLERAEGVFEGKSVSTIIFHYLHSERKRWVVKLRKLIGKGTW